MLAYAKALFVLPAWLRVWLRQFLSFLGIRGPQQIALGVLKGSFDTLLLVLLGTGFLAGGRMVMNSQYTLPSSIQNTALKWSPIADRIARSVDIPREVPLVLWFKENSMLAVNPASCTGIIGAYDLVRSGQHPCFTPGPISDIEVSEQLIIAAQEFKKRCPDITYYTQNPEVIKRCYFAYNAGAGAATRLDADQSAYVMNNYDEAHTDMVYSDVELGTVVVKQLGAWPAHLAMQSLVVAQIDVEGEERPFSLAVIDLSTRLYDKISAYATDLSDAVWNVDSLDFPDSRSLDQENCLGKAHTLGNVTLRPRLNPVTFAPMLTQDVHGCSYSLPGVDISSDDSSAILQAPMPGEVTTFTDRWANSTIRIENDEWIVWLLHSRSYLVDSGAVKRGTAVGVMGAVGYATGPHVHYTIFDKVNETFVDPEQFLP